jgi:hypothetical protein
MSTCLIGENYDPFPCIRNIWTLYSKKGPKTIVLSIGNSKSCIADLDLSELLGCPIHIIPLSSEQHNQWLEVVEIIKNKSRGDNAKYEFSKDAEKKWILSKNISIHTTLPWWEKGSLNGIETELFFPCIHTLCKEGEPRIDILKLDMMNGLERPLLFAMLDAGFRPGCIIVNWSKAPDTDNPTTLAAGHLQMCGYTLLKIVENKCVYYYTDDDLYITCSWEDTACKNPLVKEIIISTKKSFASLENTSNHDTRNISSIRKADTSN